MIIRLMLVGNYSLIESPKLIDAATPCLKAQCYPWRLNSKSLQGITRLMTSLPYTERGNASAVENIIVHTVLEYSAFWSSERTTGG